LQLVAGQQTIVGYGEIDVRPQVVMDRTFILKTSQLKQVELN